VPVALFAVRAGVPRNAPPRLELLSPGPYFADGNSAILLRLTPPSGSLLRAQDAEIRLSSGEAGARLEAVRPAAEGLEIVLRAGVIPGRVVVETLARGVSPLRLEFETLLDATDRFADGTPDFLRLDSQADRQAFRRWFVFLAESQALRETRDLPGEISDCAALLRFAYREALRDHGGDWPAVLRLPFPPAIPPVRKYSYPRTPLGAGLFRVRPGSYRAEDPAGGTFAQFADAQTLMRLNTHFITREVQMAAPGDLLFFRQLSQDLPFHAMVVVGGSEIAAAAGDQHEWDDWLVYHTGPLDNTPGEIRRVRLADLMQHPLPQWRPRAGNPAFLGVYRWNILREGN
jgi:hypothetical protein